MSTNSFMKTVCKTWLVALFITLPFCAYATPEINQENEECAISFEEQRLMKGKTYTSTMFDDIKSGSFSVSADGKTLTFENLSINGSKKLFYIKEKSAKIVLIGENIVKTDDSYVIGLEYSTLTITGSGSLTTSSSWYDIWLWPGNVNIDSTTLECNGPTAIGNNNYEKANYFNLAIRNSIFKGKKLFRLTSLTMDGCSISTPSDGIFDPDDMDGNQIKDEDWNDVSSFCIDKNINSGVQKNNDVTPQSLGTSYVLKGESLILPVKIVNRGSKPVNSVSYTTSTNGNKSAETTVSINIAPQNSATINITMPAGSETKRYEKILTITKVNGVNNEASKNSSVGSLITILEKPTPIPVVEEFTGTWCGWCTIGYDGMEKTNETFGDKVVLIAVHASDPMQISDYHSIAKRATGYPSSIINRSKEQYPDKDILDYEIKKCFDEITVGEIKVAASWADVGKTIIKINTDTKFVYTDDNSQYGIAFVLIEDGMTGKGGEWSQSNYLSGDSYYAESYPFWYNAASKVSGLEFNHVAVAAWDIENGADESVKPSFAAGEVLKYSKEVAISSKTIIQDKSKLKIAALLIDRSTGKIVNANQSPVMDDDLISYGFLYNKENLAENAIVSIDAEENDRGDGLVCETNPSADPKNGLVLSTFDKSQKTGKAKLEIVSNSLDAKQIQWCMGGECVPMNDKTVLEKTFTTDKDGIALVQFDATGIQSKGSLEAVLTTTIDNESHSVRIRFVYSDPQEPSSMSYLGTQLLINKEYTSSDFSDIKSGSFKISKDDKTIEFKDLDLNCTIPESDGCLFQFEKDVTIKLTGTNKVYTKGYYVVHPIGDLTITGSGSLTTKSTWFDFWVLGIDLNIDNTTLICEGDVAIGNNTSGYEANIVVKNSTFKGKALRLLSSFTLINCDFVSTQKIIFDPEVVGGTQLKYEDGTKVTQFEIEPVEGDYANRVSPVAFGDLYFEKNKSRTVNISVQNNGTASVSKVSYVIEIDGVAETENTYILPETVNGIGTTFDLPITITGDSKVGIRIVNLTITKVNGSENSSPDKTVSGRFVTVSPASSHRVVVEEFTGSWCGWCTRGIVGLNMMNDTFGDQVITVAAHASDPMYAKDYGFIFNFTNGYPSCVINRGELMDPYYGTSGSTPFGIQTDILQALSVPVVGSIDVQADWADNNKNSIKMKTKTTFGIDDSSSQFQIGFLLLADGLKGSGSDWAQNNFYAGSNSGDSYLRVIESLPEKITNMEYDHVAIAAWGADKGLSGFVSAPLRADVPQEFTYERNISDNPLVQDKDKLYVVALLLDKTTGKIINAAKCKVGEGSSDPTPGPNPQEGKVFEFRFENKILDNNEAVEITAEEDNWGFGEMNCETNPSSNPKNGLILASKDGKKLSGTATINIVSNTLNPQMVQWCMGGECVPMNGKSTLTKDFTTDNEGICLVMFDATNIKSEGALEARLTATVDNETRAVFIKFVYDKANGISVIYTDDNNAEWYDMTGTRLENAPTRKGVYIRNGKKVIR